jgi:hypothetical protein
VVSSLVSLSESVRLVSLLSSVVHQAVTRLPRTPRVQCPVGTQAPVVTVCHRIAGLVPHRSAEVEVVRASSRIHASMNRSVEAVIERRATKAGWTGAQGGERENISTSTRQICYRQMQPFHYCIRCNQSSHRTALFESWCHRWQ